LRGERSSGPSELCSTASTASSNGEFNILCQYQLTSEPFLTEWSPRHLRFLHDCPTEPAKRTNFQTSIMHHEILAVQTEFKPANRNILSLSDMLCVLLLKRGTWALMTTSTVAAPPTAMDRKVATERIRSPKPFNGLSALPEVAQGDVGSGSRAVQGAPYSWPQLWPPCLAGEFRPPIGLRADSGQLVAHTTGPDLKKRWGAPRTSTAVSIDTGTRPA